MGSLGDKFKKLAGDQTRQLLQNFQNAQSSKTRNGYSYGKLNEDGTATLADGTTVQVEVKGRPGQYAPVFNLGNGQGLVDQPEAKFFTVDGGGDQPFIVVVGFRRTSTIPSYSMTLKYIAVVDHKGDVFYLPERYWPFTTITLSSRYDNNFTNAQQVTVSAGFGGFTVVGFLAYARTYMQQNIPAAASEFPPAQYLIVHTFSLIDGEVVVPDDAYEIGTFDYNQYITTPTLQWDSTVSPIYSCGGASVIGLIPQERGTAYYEARVRIFIRGRSSKLITDFIINSQGTYLSAYSELVAGVFRSDLVGGDISFVDTYDVIDNGPNSDSRLFYDFLYDTVTNSAGSFIIGTPAQDFGGCFTDPPSVLRGAAYSQGGGVTSTTSIGSWLDSPVVLYSDSVPYNTLSFNTVLVDPGPGILALTNIFATGDPEVFWTGFETFRSFQYTERKHYTVNVGYTDNVIYDSTGGFVANVKVPAPIPVAVVDDLVIPYGTGGSASTPVSDYLFRNKYSVGLIGWYQAVNDFYDDQVYSYNNYAVINNPLNLITAVVDGAGYEVRKVVECPSVNSIAPTSVAGNYAINYGSRRI